jgi:hypothetical protein
LERSEPQVIAVLSGDLSGDLTPALNALDVLVSAAPIDIATDLQQLVNDLRTVQRGPSAGALRLTSASVAARRDLRPIDDVDQTECGVTIQPDPTAPT